MTFHEAGRSIRQNGGAAAVRYEVSKGLAMDEESPAHKLAEQVRGRNDRLTDTELGRLSFHNGQAAAAILEEALEDRDPETTKKVEQLLKNAQTDAMDKVPLSDLEDLKERHKENVETAKMPHAREGDPGITALQEEQDHGIINPAQDARRKISKMAESKEKNEELSYDERLTRALQSLRGKPFLTDTDPFRGNLPKKMPDRFKKSSDD